MARARLPDAAQGGRGGTRRLDRTGLRRRRRGRFQLRRSHRGAAAPQDRPSTLIETVRGRGYRLTAAARERAAALAPAAVCCAAAPSSSCWRWWRPASSSASRCAASCRARSTSGWTRRCDVGVGAGASAPDGRSILASQRRWARRSTARDGLVLAGTHPDPHLACRRDALGGPRSAAPPARTARPSAAPGRLRPRRPDDPSPGRSCRDRRTGRGDRRGGARWRR